VNGDAAGPGFVPNLARPPLRPKITNSTLLLLLVLIRCREARMIVAEEFEAGIHQLLLRGGFEEVSK